MMHVSDHESEYTDGDSEYEPNNSPVVSGGRFACDELYMSEDSEDNLALGMQYHLMDKTELAEVALHELKNELRAGVLEEARSKISSLEVELVNVTERLASLTTNIAKYGELQQGRVRKFELQYQRTIAEALDNHLITLQRDHEHMFQLEERRIRDDAACEEAKRKEKAIQEEKLQQERIKEKEEARLKSEMAERAKAAAIEAEKQAAEEAASKRASETLNAARNAGEDSKEALGPSTSSFYVKKGVQLSGRNVIKASENALELERRRRQFCEELSAKNKAMKESTNQVYHGRIISRLLRTTSGSINNVIEKAEELLELINSPGCPQSINILLFAEKIVSYCAVQRNPSAIFATCRVIVLVASQIPMAMDILIAELNRVCIYTVPKHISYSKEAFRTKSAYLKAIGYKEENGKIESDNDYIERMRCYMKLYGALVQTKVGGAQNVHGLKEGWAWLARFLNALPANLYTAVALNAFLEVAGYALHQRYKNQFEKLLRIIARDFLHALKEDGSESWSTIKSSIQRYVEWNLFKKEPEGLQLTENIDSTHKYTVAFKT